MTYSLFAQPHAYDEVDEYGPESPSEGERKEALTVLHTCRTNRAICFLKLNNYSSAIRECDLVLKYEPNNIKALYRRACGRSSYGLLHGALEDLELLLKIDPSNKPAASELAKVKKLIASEDRKTKKSLHSLFSKGGLYDEKPNVVSLDFEGDEPTVFFDLKQGEKELGRVEMKLYTHVV